MRSILEALRWRSATKVYDLDKKLEQEQLDLLLESMRLAPSSYGLQPWRIVVVNDPEIRKALRVAAYDQRQVTDASHLLVVAVVKELDEVYVERFVEHTAQTRGVDKAQLKQFSEMVKGGLSAKSIAERIEWATRQAYLAAGVLLTAAALEGIDATPMEGFDPVKFDEILGFDKIGLASQMAIALGFRSNDDAYGKMPKVRFAKEDLVIER